MPRRSGKTTCGLIVILHEVLFGDAKNIAIISHRLNSAQDILLRFRSLYENLPSWMKKAKILISNNTKWVLYDGRSVTAMSAAPAYNKGMIYDMILLEEFAFMYQTDTDIIDNPNWLGLAPIVYNPETRLIMLSSKKSNNPDHYFNKLLSGAMEGKNNFSAFVPDFTVDVDEGSVRIEEESP
jgi:hypothetical protein